MRILLTLIATLTLCLAASPQDASCSACNGLICTAGDPTCSAMGCACIFDLSPTMGHCR